MIQRPYETQRLYDMYAMAERHAATLVAKYPDLKDFEYDITDAIYNGLLEAA